MDMDLEEQYFAELVDEEELPPEFYSWLKDLSKHLLLSLDTTQ